VTVDRVAIIGGTGEEGFGLALRWAKAGIRVTIGSRDAERGRAAAEKVGEAVKDAPVDGMTNQDAVAANDVVVVTVPFGGQATIYKSLADHVREDAIVIDGTVPVSTAVGGRASTVLGVWQGSAAQQANSLLPKSVTTMGAFHTLAAGAVSEIDTSLEGDVLVCGPKKGKPIVRELVEAIESLRFVDAGGLDQARLVEPLTALLIGINRRYGTDRAGVRITGLPD
jgi:8-hydroxy-5-deazaflavin:NADPH oxidoreductase